MNEEEGVNYPNLWEWSFYDPTKGAIPPQTKKTSCIIHREAGSKEMQSRQGSIMIMSDIMSDVPSNTWNYPVNLLDFITVLYSIWEDCWITLDMTTCGGESRWLFFVQFFFWGWSLIDCRFDVMSFFISWPINSLWNKQTNKQYGPFIYWTRLAYQINCQIKARHRPICVYIKNMNKNQQ